MKRFERSDGPDTTLYKNCLRLKGTRRIGMPLNGMESLISSKEKVLHPEGC